MKITIDTGIPHGRTKASGTKLEAELIAKMKAMNPGDSFKYKKSDRKKIASMESYIRYRNPQYVWSHKTEDAYHYRTWRMAPGTVLRRNPSPSKEMADAKDLTLFATN